MVQLDLWVQWENKENKEIKESADHKEQQVIEVRKETQDLWDHKD